MMPPRSPAQNTPAFRAAEAQLHATKEGFSYDFPEIQVQPAIVNLHEASKFCLDKANGKKPIHIRASLLLFLLRDNGGSAWLRQLDPKMGYRDPNMITFVGKQLEARGLLTYCASLYDARQRFFELTEAGWDLVETLTPSRELIDEIYADTELPAVEARFSKLTQIPLADIQAWREAESPASALKAMEEDLDEALEDAPEYQASSMTPSKFTAGLPSAQCYNCGKDLLGGEYPCKSCRAI